MRNTETDLLERAREEIEKGLETCHCTKCGCMIDTIHNIQSFLAARNPDSLPPDFRNRIQSYLGELEPAESS